MAFLNNLTSRSPTARHRPMNRPVLTVEIGRLAREKERAFNRLAQHARRIQAAHRYVTVRPARIRVGLPVERVPGGEQVRQPFTSESEHVAERVEGPPDDELLAAQRQSLRRRPAGPARENWRSHWKRRPPRRKVLVMRMQEAGRRQAPACGLNGKAAPLPKPLAEVQYDFRYSPHRDLADRFLFLFQLRIEVNRARRARRRLQHAERESDDRALGAERRQRMPGA